MRNGKEYFRLKIYGVSGMQIKHEIRSRVCVKKNSGL
jgi:hypothetical protein